MSFPVFAHADNAWLDVGGKFIAAVDSGTGPTDLLDSRFQTSLRALPNTITPV